MRQSLRCSSLLLVFGAVLGNPVAAQDIPGWRVSPENVNVIVGSDRRLQILNDSAQELHGAVWSVDDPALAQISDDGNQAVFHASSVGTVRVRASLGNGRATSMLKSGLQ